MLLPLSLLAAPSTAPLYRVRHSVAVELSQDTTLADARSDGSAVGVTSFRMVNSILNRAIYVVRGRSYDPDPAMMRDGDERPRWSPVALLGGNRVAVGRFDASEARPPLYAATFGRRLRVARTALAPRPAPAAHLPFGDFGAPREFPAAWRTARLHSGSLARPLTVRAVRLPSGVELGSASLDTGEGSFLSNTEGFATIRRGGTESLLRDAVAGRPDLGAPLWVSPQGWIVAAAYRGEQSRLVWLEPIGG